MVIKTRQSAPNMPVGAPHRRPAFEPQSDMEPIEHRMRNLLAVIAMNTHLLQSSIESEASTARLTLIKDAASNGMALLEDIESQRVPRPAPV